MSTYKELMEKAKQPQNSAGSFNYLNQSPLDLDYLIHTLRNPTPDISVQKVLGFIYHYIPYVKYEHNLRVVFSSFLNNPVCFGKNVPSFEDNYLIVEVFKLIADKKLKVSQPTLPLKTFYDVILKELQHFVLFNPENSWKVLPVIAGLFLSNELRDELYTQANIVEYKWFFSDWDSTLDRLFKKCFQFSVSASTSPEIVKLSIVSLAVKYRRSEDLKLYTGRLGPAFLIRSLVELVYGLGSFSSAFAYSRFSWTNPQDPSLDEFLKNNVFQKPVVKHLNRLSFLLETLLGDLPHDLASFELIMDVASHLLVFNRQMNHFTAHQPLLNVDVIKEDNQYQLQYWFLLKGILFSQIIIFQGILTRFVSIKTHHVSFFNQFFTGGRVARMENEYRQICTKIIHSLYYLNFVLMAIGQGGFDGYNFVYYLCLEVVLQNNRKAEFEMFSRYLIGDYNEVNLHPEVLQRDYIARCKVLFALGLWENYLQEYKPKDPEFVDFVFRTTFDLVKSPSDYALTEAGHSVLLVHFSNKDNTKHSMKQVLEYFELLLSQFPSVLSPAQLSVGVETLGKKIMSSPVFYDHQSFYENSADEFLEFVFFKCASTTPGQTIRKSTNSTFLSAQPIMEIDAESTMSQLEKDANTDIVDENKTKKPKDSVEFSVIATSQKSPEAQFTNRAVPETSREAVISAFLNIIPYLPLNIFVRWLQKIWGLIDLSNFEERKFLTEKLWKILSENLDLNRCELAYVWWYETKGAVETNMGNKQTLFKL